MCPQRCDHLPIEMNHPAATGVFGSDRYGLPLATTSPLTTPTREAVKSPTSQCSPSASPRRNPVPSISTHKVASRSSVVVARKRRASSAVHVLMGLRTWRGRSNCSAAGLAGISRHRAAFPRARCMTVWATFTERGERPPLPLSRPDTDSSPYMRCNTWGVTACSRTPPMRGTIQFRTACS
jgi:hypothetical protein